MQEDNIKPGEMIRQTLEGYDANGQKISQVGIEWYGFDNATANLLQMELVKGIVAVIADMNKMKNG